MAPSEQNKSKSVFISLPNYTEYEVPHSLRAGLGSGNGSAGESLAGEYQRENSSAAIRPPACTWLCALSLLHSVQAYMLSLLFAVHTGGDMCVNVLQYCITCPQSVMHPTTKQCPRMFDFEAVRKKYCSVRASYVLSLILTL